MNFTFAICVSLIQLKNNKLHYNNDVVDRVHKIIDDIEKLKIPNYEILIAGLDFIDRKNTKVVKCNQNYSNDIEYYLNSIGYTGNFVKIASLMSQNDFTKTGGWYPGHISKKKNDMTKESKYENIVFSHDYYTYAEDWYDGYLRYGNNFDVCCNRVIDQDGDRYMDWMIWPDNGSEIDSIVSNGITDGYEGRECLIPYDIRHLSKYMYVQGSYWVAKKEIMLKFPINEYKLWAMGEDVEWSMRYRYYGNQFSINSKSTCILLKNKKSVFIECSSKTVEKLKQITY